MYLPGILCNWLIFELFTYEQNLTFFWNSVLIYFQMHSEIQKHILQSEVFCALALVAYK